MCDLQVAKKLISMHKTAAERGIKFDLPFLSLKNLLRAKRCYYTGELFTKANPVTVDRVDSSLGYVKGNVVACTHDFNSRKGGLSVTEMKLVLKLTEKRKRLWTTMI